MKTKTLSALTAASALTIGLLAAPVPASAQAVHSTTPAAGPVASEAWRDCIETYRLHIPLSVVLWYFPLEVYNGCKETLTLQATFSFGPNSACRTFPPGFRSALWSPSPYATPVGVFHC